MVRLQKEKEALEANVTRLKKEKFALANQLHLREQALHTNLSGWIIWTIDNAELEMSIPWKKIWGNTYHEGQPNYDDLLSLLDPPDRFSMRRISYELMQGVADRREKLIYLDRGSSLRLPILVKASIIPDENGRPESIVYHLTALQEETYHELVKSDFNLDLLPIPLIRIHRQSGEPLFVNRLAWKIIFEQLGEAEIQHISELIGGDVWLTVQQMRQEENLELEISLKSEKDFKLFARVSDATLDILLVDISVLRNTLSELQQVNVQLDNFVYHASHDLRAPLRTVLGLLDILKIETKTEERERCVGLIEGSVKRLDSLVVDLLSISRNRQSSDSFVKINFMVEINQSVSSFYHLGETKNLEIRTLVKQPVDFIADLTRVRIVLNNVISNAIKYRRFNVFPSFIEIIVRVDEQAAYIAIEDNGEGIEKDKLGHIFDMFYRASDTSEGSGLGLYIVRDVLQKLEGNIEVESRRGEGTKFSIMIPNRR